MQKKLIALAIAGLSGAAFAQSNVTIYGAMDATYDNVSATGCAAAGCGNYDNRGRTTMNSSYIGFKGSEALGNGLAVAWQIESTVAENAGTTNTNAASVYGWANRDSYIGLAGAFGTIAAGTLTGPARALAASLDVNTGGTGIGANTALLGKFGNVASLSGNGASVFDQRFANTIAYITPTVSGFTGVVAYVPNENRTTSTAAAGSAVNTSGYTAGLNYAQGPITAGYAWTAVKDSGTAGFATTNLIGNNRLGAKYDFGTATVGLLWDQSKITYTAGGNEKVTVWYIPVTFAIGGGKLIAQYGQAGNLTGSVIAAGTDYKAKHVEIGYEYSLSKRTIVKALYSQITNNTNANYDFLYGVSAPNTTTQGVGVSAGADPKGISIGVRHNF